MEKTDKVYRILDLYARLQRGETISKREEAMRFGVNEKSIQRDIEDIRVFLQKAEAGGIQTIFCMIMRNGPTG